ncbi:MAG: hypothetical protein U0271_31605 [Polyangiaceae bacterium]
MNTLLGGLVLALVAATSVGCYRETRVARHPHATIEMDPQEKGRAEEGVVVGDAVLVKVRDAYRRGSKVHVKTVMFNGGSKTVVLRRSELGLRLPNGDVVKAPSGFRNNRPIVLRPGEGRRVGVWFHAGRVDIAASNLVVSGARVGGSSPRTLGEVSLSAERPVVLSAPPPSEPEVIVEDQPAEEVEPQTEPAAIEPVEEEADDDAAPSQAEVDEVEPWVIGGGH